MTLISRRRFVGRAASLASLAMTTPGVRAADGFPNRPIRMIVPYAPGGGSDLLARMIAQKLSETRGWNVLVENRAGANSLIGTDAVAKSPADGYTLLLADTSHATNAALQPKSPFDPVNDFTPLTLIGSSPQLFVAHPSFAANSLAELLALPRDAGRSLAVGTTGQGSVAHMLVETLKLRTGLQLMHVPYKGGSAALADAVGGQVPMVINAIPACWPHVEARRLKVLAVGSVARHPRLPQVQTLAESVPGVAGSAWYGVLAPARLPADVLQPLAGALESVLALSDVKDKLATSFIDPLPGGPQALSRYLADEIGRWQAVVKQTGISVNG